MPKGEEHEPRKPYRPGEHYRFRDPLFQRWADQEAQESAEAFVRAVYSSPAMPQAPTASTADLDMMDRFRVAEHEAAILAEEQAFQTFCSELDRIKRGEWTIEALIKIHRECFPRKAVTP